LVPSLKRHQRVDDLVRHFGGFGAGCGSQLAIVRAYSAACSLSTIPGNSRRSSTTAASSPLSWKARGIALVRE
jgi:hypothetical protein